MSLDIQFKISENPNYLKFLRANCNWYKLLNRNPNNFKAFEEAVKREYKLARADKISQTLDTIDMLEKILVTLK